MALYNLVILASVITADSLVYTQTSEIHKKQSAESSNKVVPADPTYIAKAMSQVWSRGPGPQVQELAPIVKQIVDQLSADNIAQVTSGDIKDNIFGVANGVVNDVGEEVNDGMDHVEKMNKATGQMTQIPSSPL
eukprot:gnl/MRDRNA2_/MRDRNA2_82205_c0_seq2.p1 gnl/MRDRNA2_/MRDRNA2_82205_c0~~gnl/MRDRNA2_/MRDRNA2_82205_c0_seq2.p1  ORF type:complete len:134 (+),score=17.08 gnl/MRDRNA2_/MRDRNA2_82205_c0_seq2:104-505(+)